MHNHLDRNLTGYGADTPDPQWPGDARIAVSFVLNYEEGGEKKILNGDAASGVFLCETPGGSPIQGGRDLRSNAVRVRQPRRLLAHPALFGERNMRFTSWAVGRALDSTPPRQGDGRGGHEVASTAGAGSTTGFHLEQGSTT
jgi:hypothetical protein